MLEFVLADRKTGVEIGPLEQTSQRTTTPKPLNRLGTASGRVRRDNPMVPYLALADRTLLKVYDGDDGDFLFAGPITSFEKVVAGGAGDQIAFGATAGGWLLDFRKIPGSRTQAGYSIGTSIAQAELAGMVSTILAAVNAERASQVVAGTITPGTAVGYVGPWNEKFALEAIIEVCARLDGPDWQCVALDPLTNAGAIAKLDVAPAIGADRPEAIWEYGAGKKNVATWRQTINPGNLCNWGRQLPQGWPASTELPVEAKDDVAIADRGQFEATITGDLAVVAFRQALVDEHVRVRKQPAHVISFDPATEIVGELEYGVDYAEGDPIRFHAQERFPVRDNATGAVIGEQIIDTVDALFRLRAVTFADDDQGRTTKTFQISEAG